MYVVLSYVISEEGPYFPGAPETEFKQFTSLEEGDPLNTSEIKLFMHSGTHVDVPYHFHTQGITLDKLNAEDWIYTSPKFVDCSQRASNGIDRADLEKHFVENDDSDLLLLYTGMGSLRSTEPEEYIHKSPWLTEEAALFLVDETRVRGLAIDFLTVDEIASMTGKGLYPVHEILMGCPGKSKSGRYIFIYEDSNLEPAVDKNLSKVYAVPLLLKGLEGAPVTMFAELK